MMKGRIEERKEGRREGRGEEEERGRKISRWQDELISLHSRCWSEIHFLVCPSPV